MSKSKIIKSKNKNNSVRLLTIGTFFAFFVFGFVDNLKGATLPTFLNDLNFQYATGGTILTGAYIGFFVATLVTGFFSDTSGEKIVIILAGISITIGVTFFSTSFAFVALFIGMFIMGFGLGAIELGCNRIIADVYHQKKGKYLNLLSFFHGLGSTLAPYYAGRMLIAGFSWRLVYRFSISFAVILTVFFLFVRYPKRKTETSFGTTFKSLGKLIFNKKMMWFYFLIATYCAAEIGLGSWMAEYLQRVKGQSIATSSSFLAIYFGMIMCGRLISSFIVERIGYKKIMIICAISATFCTLIGVFGAATLSFFIPLTGLFFSLIFPTATAILSNINVKNKGIIMGIFFSFAGIGGMLGPAIIGIASDGFGLQIGFTVTLAFCILIIASLILLPRCRS